jgi:diamine N-acetyltransferase
MAVELREITSETVRAVCSLEVAVEQLGFVAPNAVSIAEAHFTPHHWMRAIYTDGDPAGFLLTYEDPEEDSFWVWRFMVDAQHQHKGIGRQAMRLLLDRWRSIGVTAAALSVIPTNRETIAFYQSLGFELTGEDEGGELVMRRQLEGSVG